MSCMRVLVTCFFLMIGMVHAERADHVRIITSIANPESSPLAELWSNDNVQEFNNTVRTALIDDVFNTDLFAVWSIGTAVASADVSLEVTFVSESFNVAIEFALPGVAGTTLARKMRLDWLSASHLLNNPSLMEPAGAARSAVAALRDHLLADQQATPLRAYFMEHVALSNEPAHFVTNTHDQNLELILPLAWDEYASLRSALFEVLCERPNVEELRVLAEGRGRSEVYPPLAAEGVDAIVTKALGKVSNLQNDPETLNAVEELIPISVYLSTRSNGTSYLRVTQ